MVPLATLPLDLLLDGVHDPAEQLVISLVETDTAAVDALATFTVADDADGEPSVVFAPFTGSAVEGAPPWRSRRPWTVPPPGS